MVHHGHGPCRSAGRPADGIERTLCRRDGRRCRAGRVGLVTDVSSRPGDLPGEASRPHTDGAAAATPRPKKQEQEHASEQITEVAPGILRMQLPIWMPGLGHVNMYGLMDDR